MIDVELPWDLFASLSAAVRAGGFASFTPFICPSEQPLKTRAVLALLLTLVLLPSSTANGADISQSAIRLVGEFAVGSAVGLLLRCLAGAAAFVARLIEQQLGIAMATELENEQSATSFAQLYQLAALALFFTVGGHRMVVAGLLDASAALWPAAHAGAELSHRAADMMALAFVLTLQLAGPVVASLLTANLVVAMVARAIPQFAASSAATPAVVAFGLFLALVGLAASTTGMFEQFDRALAVVVVQP